MFGKIVRGLRAGKISADARSLLWRNYGVQVEKSRLDDFVFRMVELHPNAHDIAILYVTHEIPFMDRSNPEHIRKTEKFVRVAKQANVVKATLDDHSLEELCDVAEKHLGLDTSSIEAKPL